MTPRMQELESLPGKDFRSLQSLHNAPVNLAVPNAARSHEGRRSFCGSKIYNTRVGPFQEPHWPANAGGLCPAHATNGPFDGGSYVETFHPDVILEEHICSAAKPPHATGPPRRLVIVTHASPCLIQNERITCVTLSAVRTEEVHGWTSGHHGGDSLATFRDPSDLDLATLVQVVVTSTSLVNLVPCRLLAGVEFDGISSPRHRLSSSQSRTP